MPSADLELGTISGTRGGAADGHSTNQRESRSHKLSSANETAIGNNDGAKAPWGYIHPSRLGLSEPSRSSLHNLTPADTS